MKEEILVNEICKLLSSKKALDIVKLDVKEKTDLADFFVICSAKSATQVRALSEYVMNFVQNNNGEIRRTEGINDGRWAIIDCANIIIHIFNDETRLFYHLERLWGDEKNIEKFVD